MPKSKIRPPRIPKAEPPKVTIANLNLQIKLLTKRCIDLVESRDQETRHAIEYRGQRDGLGKRATSAEYELENVKNELGRYAIDLAHLRGYQERVREEDEHRYGDLPGASA